MALAECRAELEQVQADNARLTQELVAAKHAYGKLFNENCAAFGENDDLRATNAQLRAACEEIAAHDNTTATAWKLVGIARAALPLRPGRSRQ
jgi:hypothetical protein